MNCYRMLSFVLIGISVACSGGCQPSPTASTQPNQKSSAEESMGGEPSKEPASQETESSKNLSQPPVSSSNDPAWGDWGLESATLAGQPLPEDTLKSISLYIDEKGYSVKVGEQLDKGTTTIRRDTSPMQIDVIGVEGPNAGKTILAIFEQPDANTLIVCYALSKPERPTEFSSTPENGYYLAKYRRKVAN